MSTIFFDELALAIINILRTDCEQNVPIKSKLILVKVLRKLIEIQNKTELEDENKEIYEWE